MSTPQISAPLNIRRVFVRDGYIYSSVTSDYLPPVPRPTLELDSPCPLLEYCQKPQWVDPRYYSLAYTPVSPRFDGPFSILKQLITRSGVFKPRISVDQFANGTSVMYRTPQKLCEALTRLETDLVQISNILSKNISLVGLYYRQIPTPSSFGYGRQHKTLRHAVRAIKQLAGAFVILMAWLSYLISMHNGILIDGGDGEPDFRVWENMLVKSGVPQDKVQELKNSEINIFDPSYPRAGVFVRYKDWAFLRTMKLCVTHKIPVWVWWEDGKQAWTPDPAVLDHVPTALELKNASVVARTEDAAAQRRHEEAVREEAAREKVAREDAAMGEMARSA